MSSINKIHAEEYVFSVTVRRLPESRQGKGCLDPAVNKEFNFTALMILVYIVALVQHVKNSRWIREVKKEGDKY